MVQNEHLTGVCIECCADLADEGLTMTVIASDPGVGLPSGDLREDFRAAQNHACWHFLREALHVLSSNEQLPMIQRWLIEFGTTLSLHLSMKF
jgi:hypothetical protein